MKALPPTLLVAGLTLMLVASCDPRGRSRDQGDGGEHVISEACHAVSRNCHKSCFKRNASEACSSCCLDLLILCDGGEKYSPESCEKLP